MSRSERWTEGFVVAAIVLAFAAVATTWAFIVPIFQAPDEPAHFDYAYQIASRGRLILAREGPPRTSPAVAALETMLGTQRIAFHPSRRVDPLYGTPEYLDALSRIAARDAGPAADRRVPTLVTTYPFGFYALVGAAIAPFVASPVTALFAARCACVAFVCCGFVFLYLLARELGFGRPRATMLLLLCAGLPLSAFVGSYVQPDDLTFAVATATLYAAARLRRRPADAASYVGFALGLAATATVKQHVALALAVVALPYSALRLAHVLRSPLRTASALVAMVIPTIVVVAASVYVMIGGHARGYYGEPLLSNLGHAYRSIAPALSEYFNYPIGITANSYWGIYGWLDAPMNLQPPWIAAFVHAGLRVGTWLAVFALVWLVARNAVRLRHVARLRGITSALRIATGDVLINAYLVFTLVMIVLYATSANVFGAQGRNWFPFVGAAIATATIYVPKVLPRGAPQRIASAAAAAFLLVYVLFGSWSAVRSVEARYYAAEDEQAIMSANDYEFRPFRGTGAIDPVTVGRAGDRYTFTVSGWIVNPQHAPPAGVILTYGSHDLTPAELRVDRRDIPARIRDPRYAGIGFSGSVPVPLSAWHGTRPIGLIVVTPDGLYAERVPWHPPETALR